MSSNEQLLTKFFQCLNAHDFNGMADCFHENATFQDIAFSLNGKKQIQAMWEMICSPNDKGEKSDIKSTVQELTANDSTGRAVVLDDYTYRDTGRKVLNTITSTFEFRDGLIFKQTDSCDAVSWANQALGGITGFIAGYVELIRRWKAMRKLKEGYPQAFQDA